MAETARMPEIRLKTERKGSHPWIYRKMLERPDPAGAKDGDAVRIYDKKGRYVGRGFYNGRSQIGLRVLDRGPEDEPIAYAFWRERIAAAARIRRETLALEETTDAYRLVNSEGDGLSGLVVDVYGPHAVCEVHSLGVWRHRSFIEQALRATCALESVHFRADERFQRLEGFHAKPAAGEREAVVAEHGVRYSVQLEGGHKTGFFCDQRENRRAVADLAKGKRLLDVCCYTGGFGIAARVLGPAREVTGVDLDEKAIAQAEKNARLNGLAGPKAGIRFVHANAFPFLKEPRPPAEHWDVLVLDPAKLAPSRADLEKAMRDYYDLNRFALRNLRPDGLFVTCSCSGLVTQEAFVTMLGGASADAGKELRILRITGAAPDHPISADCPEGLYLKVVFAQALARR
jgi:23S rRNA (cytosine1962-C5)-methyltransferase